MTATLPKSGPLPDAPLEGTAIEAMIEALARHTDEPGRLTRLYLSDSHRAAITSVTGWMQAAGMSTRLDAAGNVVGRTEGASPDAPVLLIGSHIDTVRNAGKYDGNLGVITGIAAVADLARRNTRLPFAIEVIAFGDEEGTRFPTTLSGSKAIAGNVDLACLDERDTTGLSRREGLTALGCDPESLHTCARDPKAVLGYVEVHIEQGPVLEAKGLAVGVVTAINGCSRGEIVVKGYAGHAGTLPMDMRRDAVTAVAEMVLAIEERGRATPDLVATVGMLNVPGAAVNVVAGEARASLDVRAPEDTVRKQAVADIVERIAEVAARRNVEVTTTMRYDAPAAPCDAAFREKLARAVEAEGVPPFELGSGAGHDAMAFRGLWPLAMLFVRCRGGVSHNPAEYASPEDMGLAARVLVRFLESLA